MAEKGEKAMMSDLIPIFDTVKSFYGKAKVEHNGINKKLFSYNTLVASIVYDNETKERIVEVYNTQSRTTLRHIKEFLKQANIHDCNTKKIIEERYLIR